MLLIRGASSLFNPFKPTFLVPQTVAGGCQAPSCRGWPVRLEAGFRYSEDFKEKKHCGGWLSVKVAPTRMPGAQDSLRSNGSVTTPQPCY